MSRRIFNSPKPQGFCSHGRRKWTRIPPNPSRLANGQGQGQGQGFRPPPPFTTCKWTRVAGPPTLHDLGAASKWTRVGGPPQPFTTCPCGWGAPATLHDLGAASTDRTINHRALRLRLYVPQRQTLNFAWTRIRGQRSTNP